MGVGRSSLFSIENECSVRRLSVTHIDGNLAMRAGYSNLVYTYRWKPCNLMMRAIKILCLDLVYDMCRRSCVQMSFISTKIPSVGQTYGESSGKYSRLLGTKNYY